MVIANASNVDFMIKGVTKFHAFGQDLWVTTTEIGLSIITITILILAFVTDRKMKRATEVPGTFQNIMELLVEALDKLVKETMGHNAKKFVNYIGTIFLFILFCNISGLFGLRTPPETLVSHLCSVYSHSASFSTRVSRTTESGILQVLHSRFPFYFRLT